MRQVIGYVRVSTREQASEGVSLDAQKSRIDAWALVNDMQVSQIFTDAGISGSKASNRPALKDALNAVTASGGVLVVFSLSRLARSTRDTITISERLAKADADLVSLSEKIDTTTAAGKMVFRMLAVLNEFERDLISERTAAAMAQLKATGRTTGCVPFGYELGEDGRTLQPLHREQDAVKLMRDLRETGYSYRRIATELQRRGIKTKSGNARWTHTAVRYILTRTA
jgi:site-specific DNA recombinase